MLWFLTRLVLLAAAVLLGVGWVLRGAYRTRRARREATRAAASFAKRRPELADEFRRAAQATGKPRGLVWKRCDWLPADALLVRDVATGELIALVGVTIAFEAEAGGGMEEVEAVGNLRDATAVFHWRDGRWQTEGRTVFNLSPEQTRQRYGVSLGDV
ncbi:hypothetical protein [Botrimarina colliarenosi]|uniref:hypothetical protein n=1 Tax=Botrimarina colliarenosi TaxID=2528001 RepID=UPI0011B792D6|nr:hypothetical protein [Botrimarina colliarenosi]